MALWLIRVDSTGVQFIARANREDHLKLRFPTKDYTIVSRVIRHRVHPEKGDQGIEIIKIPIKDDIAQSAFI